MKNFLYRMLGCVMLVAGAVAIGNAAISSDIRYENHTICAGGSFTYGNITVTRDTTWRDTIPGALPISDSIITVYTVRFVQPKSQSDTIELEVGSSMLWHGRTIEAPGEYVKVYKSASGCDSMTYRLKVIPRYVEEFFYVETDTTICYGGHADWRGQSPTIASTYIDTASAIAPDTRDTLYVLYLHVVKPTYKTEVVEFPSFPANYRGETFNAAGDEKDIIIPSVTGCDSIIFHVIARQQMYSLHTYAEICEGGSYLWSVNSKVYKIESEYFHTVRSKDGTRDSIQYVLHLTVHPAPTTYVSGDICTGGYYQIGNTRYNTAGVYSKKLQTVNGCDSTIILSLNVHYPTQRDTVAHLEHGQSVTWQGQNYSAPGTYTKYLTDRFGCDSTLRLVITEHRVDTMDTAVVLCPNTSIEWQGIQASSTGTFSRYDSISENLSRLYILNVLAKSLKIKEDTFTLCDNNSVRVLGEEFSEAGTFDRYYTCDTLYRITIIKPRQDTAWYNAIYNGTGVYTWKFMHEGVQQTENISEAGTHIQRLDNSTGCQNTYILNLAVDSMVYNFHDSVVVCEGDAFEWQGYTTLSSQHVGETYEYTKGYKTQTGQDSIYHLKLTVQPKSYGDAGIVRFMSFPTTYLGTNVPAPGHYTGITTSATGCDSIVDFVAQRQTIKDSVTYSICEGSAQEWQGHSYSADGVYTATEVANDGSDSVYHVMRLIVHPKAHKVVNENICQGSYIVVNGQQLSETGVYFDTLQTPNGCDSIVEIHLNVNPVRTYVHEYTRPENDTIHWINGKVLTSPTVYDTIVRNAAGCDSIIRVVVNATRLDTVREEATICQGEYKEWLGERYFTAGTYHKVDTLGNGQAVIGELKLTVNGMTKVYNPIFKQICQGESYIHFDSTYTASGTYLYPYNCDTIDSIVLTINPTNTKLTYATFNGPDPYVWLKRDNGLNKDTTITEAGTYEKRVKSSTSECYDIYRLYLSVDSASYHFEEAITNCYQNPLVWHGQDLTNLPVGTHDRYDNWTTQNGNDSIYHLALTVLPKFEKTERVEFSKFPATYRGLTFTAPGTQTLNLHAVSGCDSTITVIANLRSLTEEESQVICSGDYYEWHGGYYNATGDYTIRDTALNGDTVEYTLHLKVLNIPETHINVTICHGSSYTLGSDTYNQTGVYRHTFVKNGCDSTVVLSLNVLDASRSITTRTIQEGDNLVWHGTTYNEEGNYQFDTINSMGCDSVAILELRLIRTDTTERTVTICPDSSYTWSGRTFDASGNYEWTETKMDGNLIRYILHLTVQEKVTKDVSYSICSGESVTLNGKTYTSDTTILVQQTCDTVYRITIRRLPSLVHNYNASFDGSSYHWYNAEAAIDTTITEAGSYFKYRQNATTGCNDTHHLILTEIKPNEQSYQFDEAMTVCEGSEVIWRGNHYDEWSRKGIGSTSHYYERYTTVYGQDSIYHLALTVHPVPRTVHTYPFCDSIVWNGQTIKESKQVADTFKTATGCDSIATIYFVKGSAFHHYATDSIALGKETIEWHGQTITADGVYEDINHSSLGCDSSYTLTVTLKQDHPGMKTRTYYHSMCEGDVYTWKGTDYDQTGIYYDTVLVGTEIDSINVLNLTVNPIIRITENVTFPKGAFPLTYRGELFNDPGTKEIRYISSTGCDSIITVIVNYRYATYREDVTICAGEGYPWHDNLYKEAGIYSIVEKDADNNDSVTYILDLKVKYIPVTRVDTTICSGNSISFGGQNLSESGSYTHTFSGFGGCDSTVIMTVHVVEEKGTTEVHHMNPGETPYHWNDSNYATTGIYYHHRTGSYGCQLTDVLVLTVHHVDTIDTVATVCPNALPFKWHGIEASHNGTFTGVDTIEFDNWKYYRLDLTVRPQVVIDTTLTICNGDEVSFHGETYTDGGYYTNQYNNCDTVYNVYVHKLSNEVHITHGSLSSTEGFKWSFWRDGRHVVDSVFNDPGTYEYTSPNESGCKDVWRLILTKDENEYNFLETLTICEGDDFSWHGLGNLSLVPGQNTYTDVYQTRAGKDSIYTLELTVLPAAHSQITENFCNSRVYNGVTYTNSVVVYDTLKGAAANGCDSIVRLTLNKVQPFFVHDTATIMQGETLMWHGLTITTNGLYRDPDATVNQYGCDSTYEIGVGLIAAPAQEPIYTTPASICAGDSIEWRGNWYSTQGIFLDTIYHSPAKDQIDSIFILNLRVWPSYMDSTVNVRHLYACGTDAKITYDGKDYTSDTTFTKVFHSIHGCDSIEQVVMHFSDGLSTSESKRITDKELPYRWMYDEFGGRDTLIYNPGTYQKTIHTSGRCDLESELVLTVDQTFLRTLDTIVCSTDLPFYWVIGNDTIGEGRSHAVGDTVTYTTRYDRADPLNRADSLYVLTMVVQKSPDTVVYVHGCKNKGAFWRDQLYYNDTTFIERVEVNPYDPEHPCDSIFRVNIKIDTVYNIQIDTTICEHELPLIFGRNKTQEVWREDFYTYNDTTSCGCDSIVNLTLHIIPSLEKTDSTFICESEINDNPVILGNTDEPTFAAAYGGQYTGEWQGKWTGVKFYKDTIVYNCDSSFFHHIIVRPSQKTPRDTTFYMCEGDSVQLFWPKTTWVKKDTIYEDTVTTYSPWTDDVHGSSYYDVRSSCDSITRWTIKFIKKEHIDTTAYILLGDSILWHGFYRHHTGDYFDTIPTKKQTVGNDSIVCDVTYTLHLTADTLYHYQVAIDTCVHKNTLATYTWDDGYVQTFQVGDHDTIMCHYYDTLKTHAVEARDSIYDLNVTYHIIRDTLIFDTICPGDSLQFDRHWYSANSNQTLQQYIKDPGVYRDTITAVNGCDSIITLHLAVRDRIIPTHTTVHLADTAAPYLWKHKWGNMTNDSIRYINASGDYECRMTSVHGCDSIDSITVVFHKTYNIWVDSITICKSETPYTWETVTDITESGHYTYTVLTTEGYDSVRHVNIKVLPVVYDTIRRSICHGDSMIFGLSKAHQPRYLHQSGTYNDTLVSNNYGCDSIVTLYLNVYDNYLKHYSVDIADVDTPFVWPHAWMEGMTVQKDTNRIYASGEYRFVMPSVQGCDSIDSLSLRIHKTYLFTDTFTICQSETPYTWEQYTDIQSTGFYEHRMQTVDHYDSIRTAYITVLPTLRDTIRRSICSGDSIIFGLKHDGTDNYLRSDGTYNDTCISKQFGCDSITTLYLTVNTKYLKHYSVDIKDTDTPYVWPHAWMEGMTVQKDTSRILASGEYRYVMPSVLGCDSIDSLSLRIHKTYIFRDTVTICSSETPYTWYNADSTEIFKNDIYVTDTYYKHLQTHDNYDSTYIRFVQVLPVRTVTIHDSICAGDNNFYSFNGQKLTESGVYTYTTTAHNGCDSTVTLHLSVNHPYYSFREEHIIEGTPYNYNGKLIYRDTTIVNKGFTPNGCDSTMELKIVVHPLVDTVVTVCSPELPYIWTNKWNGQVTPLYAAGLYRNDTTFVNGVRMYYGLKLVVNNPTDSTIYKTVCEGTTYRFNGQDLKISGEYRDTLVNANGCDSTVILHLNFAEQSYHTIERSIFQGDTVHFYGETYSTTGNYPVRFTTTNGCDSVVELILTVNKLFDDSVSICYNELPLTWQNKTIYESGIYRDTITNNGKLTITGLKVNVLPIARREQPILDTICEGDFFQLGTRRLTVGGTYEDTITAANGCDSIISHVLQVMPVKNVVRRETIFEGDSVEFNGEFYKESGIYYYTKTNENKCNDTYQLILDVIKSFRRDTVASICENDLPFVWRGKNYYESCVDSSATMNDSTRLTTILHLTVHPVFRGIRNITICQNDTFHYAKLDTIFTQSGSFFDTIPSLVGCDSIIEYIVSVQPTYDRTYTRTISDQQTYDFHGRILKNAGTYKWDSTTVYGCDSTEHLILIVQPSYHFNESQNLCKPDTIFWHNKIITEGGTYYDSLRTATYGFDSIYTLEVEAHDSYNLYESIEIIDGYTTRIHGINVSKPGLYHDTLVTRYGCDSIYHIQVNTKRTVEQTQFIQICQGDTYDFFGQSLVRTGTYKHTSQHGDTTITLKLTVSPITINEKLVVVEEDGLPYIYDGVEYTLDLDRGQTDTLFIIDEGTNHHGCDSILRLTLALAKYVSPWDQMPLCPGAEIRIDDQVITKPGQYTFIRRSQQSGKRDSLYRVEVYAAPAYDLTLEPRIICYGDTFHCGGKAITRAGHYDFSLKTIEGCDSLIHVDVTVNPSYQFDTAVTIVDYESYTWPQDNRTYNKTGDYYRTWQTINDCDSTYTLHLTVDSTIYYQSEDTICIGDTIKWRGRYLADDGYYLDTVRVAAAHFSAIYSIRLVVAYPTHIRNARTGDICADEEGFDIEFEYAGYRPASYSIYFDALAKREGFKDIYNAPMKSGNTAHVDLPKFSGLCYQEHTYYVRPDYYTMRLVLDNGVCGLSEDTVGLLIKYPSWIIEQKWDDVVAPLRSEYNGGFDFVKTDWYVNGVLQPNTNGYLHSDKLRQGDQVVMYATRKGEGERSIPTCPLEITISDPIVNNEPVVVYPSASPRMMPVITIEAPQEGRFEVYSGTGMLITSGEVAEGATKVTLPAISGIYFFRISQGDKSETHKVMLY